MRDIPPDLAAYSSDKPSCTLHLLFLHHSCGGQLLADRGEIRERDPGTCIYLTHPNAGGLRSALGRNNYTVHEASYGSSLGQGTDICHWRRKFRDHMGAVLSCDGQDRPFRDGTRNRIVVFKSCFPNSWIDSEGRGPGDPDSSEKTMANYKAAYGALLEYFMRHPDTLFVACTAPPMARPVPGLSGRALSAVRGLLGRPDPLGPVGTRIRSFNNWLKDMDGGWLKGYGAMNVVVFDYYDILTGYGASDWSLYPTRGGADSHPSSEGNTRAAQAFIPFLNKAVRRAGLCP
ncbi:MAG TPA: hypothetical protein PKM41_15695 [Deltaproteobacteria bacterium]|nr:hypothetical protein [Deltaproteobacteria bacterium]HOI08203.1 hypothetical protein [Deltaproteobacteria bacterium]